MKNIFWFTGLSGAGKSTVCEAWKAYLEFKGVKVAILDGDIVRSAYPKKRGFSREDVLEGNLFIASEALKLLVEYQIVLIPVIAPYQFVREQVKAKLGTHLKIVYCSADIETVQKRDVKGLYAQAAEGKITNMIGLSPEFPYEIPQNPDLVLDTTQPIDLCLKSLNSFLIEYP